MLDKPKLQGYEKQKNQVQQTLFTTSLAKGSSKLEDQTRIPA